MRVWPALILAPVLALTSISLGYALVPAVCGKQWILHTAILVPLVLSVVFTVVAYTEARRGTFLPLVATGTGAFFSLVIAAQWTMQLFLSPCTH